MSKQNGHGHVHTAPLPRRLCAGTSEWGLAQDAGWVRTWSHRRCDGRKSWAGPHPTNSCVLGAGSTPRGTRGVARGRWQNRRPQSWPGSEHRGPLPLLENSDVVHGQGSALGARETSWDLFLGKFLGVKGKRKKVIWKKKGINELLQKSLRAVMVQVPGASSHPTPPKHLGLSDTHSKGSVHTECVCGAVPVTS